MREEIDMTRIAFGMMRLPLFDEEDQTSVDFEHVDRMAELCMEKGVRQDGRALHGKRSELL